jgi:hypothetical protein
MIKPIQVKAEHFATLENKTQWLNRVPAILPNNQFERQRLLWIDANGNHMLQGSDFSAAEDLESYPVTIYRMQSAAEYKASITPRVPASRTQLQDDTAHQTNTNH